MLGNYSGTYSRPYSARMYPSLSWYEAGFALMQGGFKVGVELI